MPLLWSGERGRGCAVRDVSHRIDPDRLALGIGASQPRARDLARGAASVGADDAQGFWNSLPQVAGSFYFTPSLMRRTSLRTSPDFMRSRPVPSTTPR